MNAEKDIDYMNQNSSVIYPVMNTVQVVLSVPYVEVMQILTGFSTVIKIAMIATIVIQQIGTIA